MEVSQYEIMNLRYRGGEAWEMHLEAEIAKHLHREQCLEAEVRRLRQCLRNLSEAVIAGQADTLQTAHELRTMLSEV